MLLKFLQLNEIDFTSPENLVNFLKNDSNFKNGKYGSNVTKIHAENNEEGMMLRFTLDMIYDEMPEKLPEDFISELINSFGVPAENQKNLL